MEMDEAEDLERGGVICPECGGCPTEIFNGDQKHARRGRRIAFFVWLSVVVVSGVVASPWVQVWLGYWGYRHGMSVGNMNAVMDDRVVDVVPGDSMYQALVEPPIRWRDLELVAQGDVDAVEYFRRAVEQVVEYPSNINQAYSSYEFVIGTPKYFFNPGNDGYRRIEDGEYQYAFLNKEYAYIGWPDPWVGEKTTHWYRPDPERFSEAGLLSVKDDLIDIDMTEIDIRWRNMLFVAGLVVLSGYVIGRVCIWRQVDHQLSIHVGFVVMIVLAAGVLVTGMQQRNVHGWGITGYMNPANKGVQRAWDNVELEAILESDEQVRVLAETLLEDFGEMTQPSELVALGIGSSVGEGMYALSFGYGQFRLMSFALLETARLEDDGSYTILPVLEVQNGWNIWRRNGIFSLNRSWGKPAMVSYGGLIEYRNLFFVVLGFYLLLKILGWITRRWSRRIRKRRVKRGECAHCRYPIID